MRVVKFCLSSISFISQFIDAGAISSISLGSMLLGDPNANISIYSALLWVINSRSNDTRDIKLFNIQFWNTCIIRALTANSCNYYWS